MWEWTAMEWAGYGFALVYALWIFYLAVMNIKRAKDLDKLRKPALVMGYPVLLVGYSLDMLANLTVFTVLLLELPRELTVTARLKRHAYGPQTWRRTFSLWFAHNLLDVFDPSGKHV